MKKAFKKSLCLFFIVLVALTTISPCFAIGLNNNVLYCQDGYITLTKGSKIDSSIKEVTTAKLIMADATNVSDYETDEIKEITDNGTDIFIKCKPSDQISKIISKEKEISCINNGGCFIGWYIHNDGISIKQTPVNVICMYEKDTDVSEQEFLFDCLTIANNCDIEPKSLYESFGDNDTLNLLYKKSNTSEKATLQSNINLELEDFITSSFYKEEVYYYAYKKGALFWKDTLWDESASVNNYDRIGYAKLFMAIRKLSTESGMNYDTLLSAIIVGAENDTNYYVKEYSAAISAMGAAVFQPKIPPSTSAKTVTTAFATSWSSNGVTNTVETSVSNNPNGQSFSFALDGPDVCYVYAEPQSNADGLAWGMTTGATVGYEVGAEIAFIATVKDLEIKNLATYTLPENYVGLVAWVKNHTKIY